MSEAQLRELANDVVKDTSVTQAQIAQDLTVKQPTVSQALKGRTNRKYTELLIRIIERYSDFRIEGPEYRVKRVSR